MKKIIVSNGMEALVDDADFIRINKHTWTAQKRATGDYHAARYSGDTYVYMHHEVLELPHNEYVDHKDGNGLNNQRYNLRKANKQQNAWNSKKKVNCRSKYKGVSICTSKSSGLVKWRATIQDPVTKRSKHLGVTDTEEEAALLYDRAALTLFGEFARINFPNPHRYYNSHTHSH